MAKGKFQVARDIALYRKYKRRGARRDKDGAAIQLVLHALPVMALSALAVAAPVCLALRVLRA